MPYRIVHISTTGMTAEKLLLPQCRFLSELGYEVGFIFSPSEVTPRLRGLGYMVEEVPMTREIAPIKDLRSVLSLARAIRKLRPHLVHTHTSKAGVLGRIAARLGGVPVVVHTQHGYPIHDQQPFWQRFYYLWAEKLSGLLADEILSQGREDVDLARKLRIRSRHGELLFLGNGINVQAFQPQEVPEAKREALRSELVLAPGIPVLTMVGRLNVEKGYLIFIEALAGLRDESWTALCIGPDEGFGQLLRQRLLENGLMDRVKFLGKRDDVREILAVTDIFVLPSYREGVPRSLLEAQAMEVAAVATDIRGCREIIREGETGFLVPTGDSEALEDAIRRLLADPSLRRRMGFAGRKRVTEDYDEKNVFARLEQVYESLLGTVPITTNPLERQGTIS